MGRRGPIPMSSALRAVRGNPGRRRQSKTEPTVPAGLPEPPEFLSEIARQEWDRIAPELLAAGLLTALDRAGLAVYCVLWADVVACADDLKTRGADGQLGDAGGEAAGLPGAEPEPRHPAHLARAAPG